MLFKVLKYVFFLFICQEKYITVHPPVQRAFRSFLVSHGSLMFQSTFCVVSIPSMWQVTKTCICHSVN